MNKEKNLSKTQNRVTKFLTPLFANVSADKWHSRMHRYFQVTFSRVSSVELNVFGTMLGLNMAQKLCFDLKTRVTKVLTKNQIFCFLQFLSSVRAFQSGLKVMFQNFIFRRATSTGVAILLAKKLSFLNFFGGGMLNFRIFEKNIVPIDNFKSGKIQKNLHFEKHGHLGNQFCQVPMFLDFRFLHFPCKFEIINGRGSDVILRENKVKTG